MAHLIQRGKRNTWHLFRRVPKRFEGLEHGPYFTRSLKTESLTIAEAKAADIWALQLATWEARLAGAEQDAEALHRRLVDIAEKRGFAYLPAATIADGPLQEILDRIDAATSAAPEVADAVLGAADRPPIVLSNLFAAYRDIVAVDIRQKSPAQLRKWENDRQHAINQLIGAIGDVDALTLTRSDAMRYRSGLARRIEAAKLEPYSANRAMITAGAMIKTIAKAHGVEDPAPFSGLLFKDSKKRRRHADLAAFPSDWIAAHILAPDALSKLNTDARAILQLCACLGTRPSELCALSSNTIHLSAPVPYVSIEADGREVKTAAGERRLPLTGRALRIVKDHPAGFPRYLDKAASWSATVNKHLREKTPLPSPNHTAYSLRHSFRDRLRAVGCPDTLADQMFGHEEKGTAYGQGATLDVMRDWLDRVEIS